MEFIKLNRFRCCLIQVIVEVNCLQLGSPFFLFVLLLQDV